MNNMLSRDDITHLNYIANLKIKNEIPHQMVRAILDNAHIYKMEEWLQHGSSSSSSIQGHNSETIACKPQI